MKTDKFEGKSRRVQHEDGDKFCTISGFSLQSVFCGFKNLMCNKG
jgi:hypothetical protein